MATSLKVQILTNNVLEYEGPLGPSLELGRQRQGEPGPYTQVPATTDAPPRLVVASHAEGNVSRNHVLLQSLPSGEVQVTNRSKVALPIDNGAAVLAGKTMTLKPPFSLSLGNRCIAVVPDEPSGDEGIQELDQQTLPLGALGTLCDRVKPAPLLPPQQVSELASWLQSTIAVLQSAVGSSGFLQHAADALVQIVGLSSGRVLLFDTEPYSIAAVFPPTLAGRPWQPSQNVLRRVRSKKSTFFQPAHRATSPHAPSELSSPADTPSLLGLQTIVASPLLDRDGNVIGALYGERREEADQPRVAAGKLEASLVELLACGISTGLARQQQEQAALAARVQFEQFFTPALARQLAVEPDLLKGADREVSLLFCDVRGFSAFSERLGPEKTVEWINDVMSTLSECVLNEEGVLVDYIGDEMLAMWGAPFPQPDQAERAARAALAMIDALPALNERWRPTLDGDMGFGIGLNTGIARVGNTGSKFKFKYGPLGNTVNLASRVQGLTKYLKSRLLVTAATRSKLGADFIARRVVKTRVVNIKEPVDLYEVERVSSPEQAEFFSGSEAALDALEEGRFADAARRAGGLLPDHPGDGPLQLVLSRASEMLMKGGAGFDPIWEPPGK